MNVLVTGGTGFVGGAILPRLRAEGHAVRILVRDPRSRRAQAAARIGAELLPGGVLREEALANAPAGCDAVVHLVGLISELGEQTFENVHVRGTQNLLAAARRVGVKRFVHMSSLGTRPDASSRYHRTKWAAEEAVRNSGLEWTIFRPSVIYGPEDRFVNLFAGMARFSPALPVFGSGQNRLQPVSVENVATAFVKALTTPQSIGKTYDLCGPEPLTMVEVLRQILTVARKRRLIVRVPFGLARIQAALLESVFPSLLGQPPPLNRDQLLMLREDNVGNPQPAEQLFGFRQRSFRDGIAGYVD